MRIHISTDLEGISGITTWDQTRDFAHSLYQEARHLLTAEINACVEGCLAGGETDIVVNDGHGGAFNIVPAELHPGASYVTGPGRPWPSPDLKEKVDGLILLGYHAMNGVVDGVLHHTQSSLGENKYWYNGVESGEIAQTCLVAGTYDIPPILCTGDLRACQEATRFLGEEVVTVSVKEGYSRTSCRMLAPRAAHELIRESAQRAIAAIPRCKPYKIALPITARLQMKDAEAITRLMQNGLSKRVDEFTLERVIDDPRDIYRF
jgi:D-amino peptidase